MIPFDKYPHVNHDDTLLKAMEVLENAVIMMDGQQSLPRVLLVMQDENSLIGVIGRRHILKGLEPKYLVKQSLKARKKLFDTKVDPALTELHSKRIVRGILERSEQPVSEMMEAIKATIDYDDHIFKAVYEMNENDVSLLPVFKDNHVIGVVRTVEIFQVIAKDLLEQKYIW